MREWNSTIYQNSSCRLLEKKQQWYTKRSLWVNLFCGINTLRYKQKPVHASGITSLQVRTLQGMRLKSAHLQNHTGLISNSSHCYIVQHRTSGFFCTCKSFAIWSALCATIFTPQMFSHLHQLVIAVVNFSFCPHPKMSMLSSANFILLKTTI